MLIGCCIGDIASPFAGLLLKGITETCESAGYQVLFADSKENSLREQRAIEGFLENRVDGLIVNTTGGNDEFLIRVQNERGVPVVLADRSLQREGELDTVISEYRHSTMDCVELMLRYAGKRDGAEPFLYEFSRENEGDCLRCVQDFRARFPGERIAVLAVNGVTAMDVLCAMQQAGITPGYDFGFCTFDDWSWFSLISPGITAVRQETKQLGARAAELLLERLRGEREDNAPAVNVELPTTFMERGSLMRQLP